MSMLWYPSLPRRTRSGREFSALSLPTLMTPLKRSGFDYAPLVANACAAESPDQEDHEDEDGSDAEDRGLNDVDDVDDACPSPSASDPLNDVDEAWPAPPPPPPPPPHDPWDDVDDENPPTRARKRRRRDGPPTFVEVVSSAEPPHAGPHRTRPAKPHRLAKKHAAATARRQARRQKNQQSGHVPAASTADAHIRPAAPLQTGLDSSSLPAALGAYAARVADTDTKYGSKVRRSLGNLLGLGFQLVEWDGVTPIPLIDSKGRIIAVLAGQPCKDEYRAAAERAFQLIRDAGAEARFPASMRRHRRGLFAAINVGLSYGKGQTTPCWLNNKEYTGLADRLLADKDIRRLAGFADAAFALWAPCLYTHYRNCDAKLRERHPDLRRPFGRSVFFCAAFNFGRNVWTFKHRDVLNLAFGWCAVQALGRFNPKKGGHLVLWDLRLVIEFPPGALILLPSATIAHSNVPVQEDEERVSFTQFSAGGIFRYVDNGCQTVSELAQNDPAEYERLMALKAGRWEEGLKLLSTVEELTTAQ